MSASDAAPLPRLGEVFFDVRGNSRSMRLSWYADTDVAVFSIWQGGKCTGTFRLPMDDLSRMIEILRRGPEGRAGRRPGEGRERGTGERGAADRGTGERRPEYGARGRGFGAAPEGAGGYDSDKTVVRDGRTGLGDYGAADYGAGQYGAGDFGARDLGPEGHGPGEYGSDVYTAGDYWPGDDRSGDYRPADQRSGEYDDYSRSRSARHRTELYEPADYGQPDYDQDGEWWPDSDQADRTRQPFVPADGAGYGEQRFAPPYGRPQPDSSEEGFMDDSEYRLPADPAGRSRHSAGRHSGGQG
jgi:hypothetical protein